MKLQVKRVSDRISRSDMTAVVESLGRFRREWQKMAAGQSLIEVESSVGLILCDISERLALSPQERFVVLGRDLAEQIETFVKQPLDLEIVQ